MIHESKLIDESQEDIKGNLNTKKNQLEVRFSQGEDDLSQYLNDGWMILKKYSEEKICTWRSFPDTKGCDMEKDKGCKITKPDNIGEEKIYLLQS